MLNSFSRFSNYFLLHFFSSNLWDWKTKHCCGFRFPKDLMVFSPYLHFSFHKISGCRSAVGQLLTTEMPILFKQMNDQMSIFSFLGRFLKAARIKRPRPRSLFKIPNDGCLIAAQPSGFKLTAKNS